MDAASAHVPRRFVLGAVLSGLGVAALAAAGVIGVAAAPTAESFRFARGTSLAPGESERLDAFLNGIAGDPRRQLRIIGHSGTDGPSDANLALSNERAAIAVERARSLGIARERIVFSGGLGGAAPLARLDGESDRGYQSRLARVEIQTFEAP